MSRSNQGCSLMTIGWSVILSVCWLVSNSVNVCVTHRLSAGEMRVSAEARLYLKAKQIAF